MISSLNFYYILLEEKLELKTQSILYGSIFEIGSLIRTGLIFKNLVNFNFELGLSIFNKGDDRLYPSKKFLNYASQISQNDFIYFKTFFYF